MKRRYSQMSFHEKKIASEHVQIFGLLQYLFSTLWAQASVACISGVFSRKATLLTFRVAMLDEWSTFWKHQSSRYFRKKWTEGQRAKYTTDENGSEGKRMLPANTNNFVFHFIHVTTVMRCKSVLYQDGHLKYASRQATCSSNCSSSSRTSAWTSDLSSC